MSVHLTKDAGSALHSSSQLRLRHALAATLGAIAVLLAGAASWWLAGSHAPAMAAITSPRIVVLQSADGETLLHAGSLQLAQVDANDMPPDVVNAVVSIEDRRFFLHGGVDWMSVMRALKKNIEVGRVVGGGSTITQQLAKTVFLGPERTYRRKVREAATALWLERHLTKDQILTAYLNSVYLGSGAVGFPAAAKLYFGKKVAELSLPEAAMLAGLINAPSRDDPYHDLNAARRRATTVLNAMVANGKLTEHAALEAKLHPATPDRGEVSPASAGWFADWVYHKVVAAASPLGGTVHIRTTLDRGLQDLAAKVVKSALARYGSDTPASQAALVAMRPDGDVVAMIGGRDYARSQYNRAVEARRQPGAAFKLFDYYAALRQGFTPENEILDAPVDVKGMRPESPGRQPQGKVTLGEAFAGSLNGAAVRLSQEVGNEQVIAAARDLGLRAPLEKKSPSLALGTAEVALIDLTSAYAAVRAGRAPVSPQGISAIKTADDKDFVPLNHLDSAQHSLGSYQAELISLLQRVVERGSGRAAALKHFSAGSPGVSQDSRDAWFVGFDDSLVVGVWVGNDDHGAMDREAGGSLPIRIWKDFMEQADATTVAGNAPPTPLAASTTVP